MKDDEKRDLLFAALWVITVTIMTGMGYFGYLVILALKKYVYGG